MRNPTNTECRCKQCQALLAKRDHEGLAIRRGDMQISVTGGEFTVAVTCYRCKTLNLVLTRTPAPPPTATAA